MILHLQNPINTGRGFLGKPFKTLSILGALLSQKPSKPYQYWDYRVRRPSKPYQYWVALLDYILQNPINTGSTDKRFPSKPYQYWERRRRISFKTLSILGTSIGICPSKPYQYWVIPFLVSFKTLSILGEAIKRILQNPINTGSLSYNYLYIKRKFIKIDKKTS